MRTYTLFVSVAAHVAFVCLVFVTSAIATGDLPDPRHATSFVLVTPEPPPLPPSAPPSDAPQPPSMSADAAPLYVPDGIQPERAEPIARVEDVVPLENTIPGTGVVANEPPPPPPAPVTQPPAPVRVGGAIRPPQKMVHIAPVYPPLALASRVSGVVILEAVIAEDGSVQQVRVLRSPPLLEQAAVDAVRQWRFTPTLLNGQPVPIVMTVTVAFNLN